MKKIIIMGLAESGKTTIVRVSAEGYVPKKDDPLNATIGYKRKIYTMYGRKISLFDLGGQKSFLERFVGSLANFIFTNVAVMIYVVDIIKVSELSLCKYYLELAIENLRKYSPSAQAVIFLHKMDLIDKSKEDSHIRTMKGFFMQSKLENVTFYETSVFDNSTINTMEKIISKLTDEPKSYNNIIHEHCLKFQKHLQEILLLDINNKVIYNSSHKVDTNIEKKKELSKNIEGLYNDRSLYSLSHLENQLFFTSYLPDGSFLLISYSLEKMEIPGGEYLSIISGSIKLLNDLINFK
ncbi:MAG: hypothetical protein HeimC3_06390 [Candidatus Heimdallarchaeota archaeon LC_3]|nr:MAG: hypothetical protein HeimC3_06390 [Candidatus Heimdallarchaeota archaeon LC_3]